MAIDEEDSKVYVRLFPLTEARTELFADLLSIIHDLLGICYKELHLFDMH